MEGIYVGKVTRSKVDKNSADLLFIDHRQDIQHLNDIIKFDDTAYCLVPSDDIIINNDELLKLRDEVQQLKDECNEWKVRYSTVNNQLFLKGLAYGTLETEYKNEKIAGEILLKDRDALKEKVGKLEAELTEIKTARTLREAYVTVVEKGCEDLREARDRWKNRCNSVMTDISNALSANGIEFTIKDVLGDIVWTYCDGFVHVSSGISGIINADQIATGTVPKCSSCAHYMHNPSRFTHDWCYMPIPKEGGSGYIRKLNKEESEGPACDKFEARKE